MSRKRWVPLFVLGYGLVVGGAWIAIRFLGDRVGLANAVLFGPRWILVIPALLLGPVTLWTRRYAWSIATLAILLFVIGPVMDFRISSPLGAEHQRSDLRVMTHNIDGMDPRDPRFLAVLREVDPDVIALQECIPKDHNFAISGYFTDFEEQICLISRFPILKVDARDRTDVWERGGSGAIVLYTIDAPKGPIQILDLHLETVREAFVALKRGDLAESGINIDERRWESELAEQWSRRATAPLLIMGDFNMPVESAIYRQYWSEYANAFSDVGFGWGSTKWTRFFGVRIDHVLSTPSFEGVRAWVGPPTGSDHRPMIADYRYVTPAASRP